MAIAMAAQTGSAQMFLQTQVGVSPRWVITPTAYVNVGYEFTDSDYFGPAVFVTAGYEHLAGWNAGGAVAFQWKNFTAYAGYGAFKLTAPESKLTSKTSYPIVGFTINEDQRVGLDVRYMGNGLHFTWQYSLRKR